MFKLKQLLIGSGVAGLLSTAGAAHAATMPTFTEGFEGTLATLATAGWVRVNNSSPLGTGQWTKGNTADIPAAQSGTAGSFVEATYLSAAESGGAVSNWLLTPVVTIGNGYTFSFWYRTADVVGTFADAFQVRYSTSGSGANVGTTATSVGTFTNLIGNVNPSYSVSGIPSAEWTMFTSAPITGLTGLASGRFAIRYAIDDTTVHGNLLGIDSVVVTAVPEPGTTIMLALGLSIMGLSLRRRAGNRLVERMLAPTC